MDINCSLRGLGSSSIALANKIPMVRGQTAPTHKVNIGGNELRDRTSREEKKTNLTAFSGLIIEVLRPRIRRSLHANEAASSSNCIVKYSMPIFQKKTNKP